MSKNNQYVGKYLQPVEKALAASALSGVNCMVISKDPGWGKTDVTLLAARQIVGKDHTVFIRIDPATPMAIVEGAYDPAALMNGKLVRLTAGTAYDPEARIVILDELPRGSDAMFDKVLDIADRRDIDNPPTVWGTANFMVNTERSAPMRDRFGLWVWMMPSIDSVGPYIDAMRHGNELELKGKLPTQEEIDTVRAYVVGDNAHNAISDFIGMLSTEAMAAGFKINPRRLRQWYSLIYRYSAWLTGSDDFSEVPADAKEIMQYAWPTPSYEEHAEWANVARSLHNMMKAAVMAALNEAKEHFEQIERDIKTALPARPSRLPSWGRSPRWHRTISRPLAITLISSVEK